uniref:Uncharacterized protein n=2 Tax=Salarias fasciatus TaxID=181472 RepID=A0A672HUX9_SALFA
MTKWLDDVQNVWGNYLPSHLLASLRHFALKEQFDLKQKTASLDQETGASAQAPDFKEDHKLDMPTEEDKDLPPVNPLVEDARKRVKKLWVALAKTRSRVQTFKNQLESCEKEAQKKISDQFPNDSSTLLVFKVDLHRVMRAEIRDHIKKCGKELEQSIECEPQKHLRMKHGCVVALTQKLKKSKKVIKNGNETILMFRTQIVHFHTELQELIHTKLVRLIEDIITSARLQKNAIVKEARQLQITPLTSLDRRNVEGERRIPALQLSINHLQSQAFNCLCQKLKFPLYKTPQELWASLYSKQLELRWLHCNMKLSSKNLQKTIEMAPWLSSCDDSDCLSRLTEADAKHLKSVTFKANYLVHFLQTSHRLKCRLEFFMSIWLRQPAKHAQPWKSERGRTYAEWLKRWNRALASL